LKSSEEEKGFSLGFFDLDMVEMEKETYNHW